MTINATMRAELASLSPTSLIELYELQTNSSVSGACEVYRFHAGVNGKIIPENLVWNSEAYQAWPVAAEGFEYTGKGTLPRPRFRIANVEGAISGALLSFVGAYSQDLIGAQITRLRTLARFIDAVNFEGGSNPFGTPDPTIRLPDEIYFVDRKSVETREFVEFECVSTLDLQGTQIPRRFVLKNACSWVYRANKGCSYDGTDYFNENDFRVATAEEDVCGKQLSSCQKRFGRKNDLPFGGFPGAGPYSN